MYVVNVATAPVEERLPARPKTANHSNRIDY